MPVLAGYPLPLVTPEIRAMVRDDLDPEKMALLAGRSWPGFGLVGLGTPTGARPWPPPVEIGRTHFPMCGATRYAVSWQLVDSDTLNGGLHSALFGSSGSAANTVNLVMSSTDETGKTGESVTIKKLAAFPPVPLYRCLKGDGSGQVDMGLYLLALVDPRYFWNDIPTPDFLISESAGKTWANVFTAIGTAINATITPGLIASAYLTGPSRAVNLTNEPIPQVIDSVCATIGHRFVVDFSGNLSTQPFSAALKAYQADGTANPNRSPRAGGARFVDQL